jgi:curved DNA-binding protein CbpA
MDKYGNMTRKEACYYLGIGENASEEQIKRAYRYKAKLYHPDMNPDTDTKDYYIKVQKAYEYLLNHPNNTPLTRTTTAANSGYNPFGSAGDKMIYNTNSWQYNNLYFTGTMGAAQANKTPINARPAKVYASTAAAKASYKRQKEKEKDREKIQKWEEEYKNTKKRQQQMQFYGKEYTDQMTGTSKSTEEEILEKIRAIWLAETIKRQIALDKEHKEVLQRRKLHQAFMQQQMQEDERKK